MSGTDDGFAEKDRAHAESLENLRFSAIEHADFAGERGEALRFIGAKLKDSGRACSVGCSRVSLRHYIEAAEKAAFNAHEGQSRTRAQFLQFVPMRPVVRYFRQGFLHGGE